MLASGGLDSVGKLWDSDSGKLIATLAEHVSGGGNRDETAGVWLWLAKREP
ncbi:hypothetical protein [Novipirellula caenicola]|uniref:hypothetical protein n=1 Tax=Novipirellula caenicola TaxID=1536901 RepID=UPI0031E9F5F4